MDVQEKGNGAAHLDSQRLDSGRGASSGCGRVFNVRTRSFEALEGRYSKYYKRNSIAFGQVLPVNDEDALEQFSFHARVHEEDVDLESAEGLKGSQGQYSELQDVRATTAGLQKQEHGPKTADLKAGGKQSRLEIIMLEQNWLSVYKRLGLLAIVLNFIGLMLAEIGHFPYARSNALLFSLGNIVMCVMVRNEVFLRILFWLAVHLLGYWWVPVQLKTMTTSVLQSVGGIHSGCGLGSIMWLAYAILLTFRNLQAASNAMIVVAFGVLFLLLLSSLAAFPIVRHIHHNFFERVHRFAGWSSLGMVWTYVVLDSFWVASTKSYQITNSLSQELVEMQALWLTVVSTIMIILPWLTVRKVAVETVVPATKLNSLLHFKGGVKPGLLTRISPSPFSEWHAFGIISDGKTKHTIVAGAVGDFTRSLVERPPTDLWIRTFYFSGLPYLTNLYQRVIHVATGSGVCVFLSFLLQETKTDVHLIWIAKSIRANYGDEIWQAVNNASSDKITVIDTAVTGRPKTGEVVVTKAKELRAEVVIVTSNPSGTNEVVNACKKAGIPAFGPIWDS